MNAPDPAVSQSTAAFVTAVAGLVSSDDALAITTRLLLDATVALAAAGAGLIIARDGDLELLASTSHRVEQLELFQLQAKTGPCVEVTQTGVAIIAATASDIEARWPELAAAFRRAGVIALSATPMRWHGHTLGAINLFWNTAHDPTEHVAITQAYADVATAAIVHTAPLAPEQLSERIRSALTSRHIVEQAKGVLAYRDNIDMQAAYERLLQIATRDANGISAAAADIVEQAHTGPASNEP